MTDTFPTAYYVDQQVAIYQGDARELLSWLCGDVLVTDPPYALNTPIVSGGRRGRPKPHGQRAPEWDAKNDARRAVLALWGDRPAVVFDSPSRPHVTGGGRPPLIWDKGEVGMGDTTFPWRPNYELIHVLGDGFAGKRTSSILSHHVHPSDYRQHPAAKPVSLMRELITKCPPGTIIDPFCGSGPTLQAAKDLGRMAVGVELDERYCAIAASRLRQEVLFAREE